MRSLLCKVPLLAFVCILLCSSLTMGAPVFYEDFDGFTPQHFLQPVKGRNQDGTVVSVARDGYPFGPAAIQVDYVFSGAGKSVGGTGMGATCGFGLLRRKDDFADVDQGSGAKPFYPGEHPLCRCHGRSVPVSLWRNGRGAQWG